MPVCSGDSEIQPGVPTIVTIDPTFMGSLLPAQLGWLVPFLPFIPSFTLSLSNFCALDPPEDPEITADDLVALVTRSQFALVTAATAKLTQLMHILAWYRFCRCADNETPTPFTPPTEPTGTPSVNPPGYVSPVGPVGTPCAVNTVQFSRTYAEGTVRSPLGPLIPAGVTSYRVRAEIDTTDWIAYVIVRFNDGADYAQDASSPYIQRNEWNSHYETLADDPGPNFVDGTRPSGPTHWWVDFRDTNQPGSIGSASATVTIEWYCGSTVPTGPGGVQDPCVACPPDPNLVGLIAQLQIQMLGISELVTLIQRQAVPFATIDGDLHSGLTGEGELAVQGLVGVRVGLVDTLEGTVGATAGHPETLWNTGWIRWGDSAGWRERIMLDSEVTLSTPYAASAMTKIAYSLPPGAEVDIVELEREP